jgi:hypothetical protein
MPQFSREAGLATMRDFCLDDLASHICIVSGDSLQGTRFNPTASHVQGLVDFRPVRVRKRTAHHRSAYKTAAGVRSKRAQATTKGPRNGGRTAQQRPTAPALPAASRPSGREARPHAPRARWAPPAMTRLTRSRRSCWWSEPRPTVRPGAFPSPSPCWCGALSGRSPWPCRWPRHPAKAR